MKLPIYYYDIIVHPMIQEIKVVNKNNLDVPILYYDLSKLIGKEVKHFKRDIVNDEDRFRYIYRIKDFVLDANEPSKIKEFISNLEKSMEINAKKLVNKILGIEEEDEPISKKE